VEELTLTINEAVNKIDEAIALLDKYHNNPQLRQAKWDIGVVADRLEDITREVICDTVRACKYCEGKPVIFKAETADGLVYICGQLSCLARMEKQYSPGQPIELYWVEEK